MTIMTNKKLRTLRKHQPVIISILLILGGWLFHLSKGLLVYYPEYGQGKGPKTYSSELIQGWGAGHDIWIVVPGIISMLYLIFWATLQILYRYIFKTWKVEIVQQIVCFLLLIPLLFFTLLVENDITHTIIEDRNIGLFLVIFTIRYSFLIYLAEITVCYGRKVEMVIT